MPKQFLRMHGKVYRVDDKTGDIQRVTFEDINNTTEAKEVIANLALLAADKLKDGTE
jgi:hypothetical protein